MHTCPSLVCKMFLGCHCWCQKGQETGFSYLVTNGPVDVEYCSYRKKCQCMIFLIVCYLWCVQYIMWGLSASMTGCLWVCVYVCSVCGSNSGLTGCISSANIVLSLSLVVDKLCLYILCFRAFSPPPHLPSWCQFLLNLFLSCLDAFSAQQVIPKVKTLPNSSCTKHL